jgi:SAM-dependent methyltransferase
MDDRSKRQLIGRYEERLANFGIGPEALGWGKTGREEARFTAAVQIMNCHKDASVLDIGCGFASLYDFLIKNGWEGRYVGVDVTPGIVTQAKALHPNLDIRELDASAGMREIEPCDYVFCMGAMNERSDDLNNEAYIRTMLETMFDKCKVAVVCDFLSPFVDFQHPIGWHTDLGWISREVRKLTRRFVIRHDYMPFAYTVYIYRDDSISSGQVFNSFEDIVQKK